MTGFAKMTRKQFDELLATLYRGTYASRDKLREAFRKFETLNLEEPLTEQDVENYVDRIRLYQEEYRRRKEAGYIGVGLIFEVPSGPTEEGEAWLEEDRRRESAA